MLEMNPKPRIYIPLKVLPEARDWKVGQTYEIKVKVKQLSLGEDDASFEVITATPGSSEKKPKSEWLSDTGKVYA